MGLKIGNDINYLTGETHSQTKMKPDVGYSGDIHVELFDAETGEKTFESLDHNCITSQLAKMAFYQCYYQQILNRTLENKHVSMRTANSLFDSIILLNDTTNQADNPDNRIINGQFLAWADAKTPYANEADNTTRGTINLSESTPFPLTGNNNTLKLVFNFGTNVADGTYNKIGFVPYNYWANVADWAGATGNNTYNIAGIDTEDEYFINNGVSFVLSYNTNKIIKTTLATLTTENITITGVNTYIGMAFDDTNVYLIGQDSQIYSTDLTFSTLTKINVSSPTISILKYNANTVINSLAVTANYIYVLTKDTNGGSNYLYKIHQLNKDGTYNKLFETHNAGYYNSKISNDKNNYIYVCGHPLGSHIHKIFLDDGTIITDSMIVLNHESNSSALCSNITRDFVNGKMYGMYNAGNYIVELGLLTGGSHCLLSSPITKTNTVTMTITYTFSCKPVDVLGMSY